MLAAHSFQSTLTGDLSLSRRPMRRVTIPLIEMGAIVMAKGGFPPITIIGKDLRGIEYTMEVASAQVKSAVLLAGMQTKGVTTVIEPTSTRDHTERAFKTFGIAFEQDGRRISVEGPQQPTVERQRLEVPGDISSAAFWACAAAALPGSEVEIVDVGLNPTRTGWVEALKLAGADIELTTITHEANGSEPVGRMLIRPGTPRRLEITPDQVAGVIDELPVLGALATFSGYGITRDRGARAAHEGERSHQRVRGGPGGDGRERQGAAGRVHHRRRQDAQGRLLGRRGARSPAGHGLRGGGAGGEGAGRRSRAPTRWPCRIRSFSRRWTNSASDPRRFGHHPGMGVDPPTRGVDVNTDKVYLVGFMTAGKSTVARALAARLDWLLFDLDLEIEARERKAVAEIFAARGEAYFRELEREALARLVPVRHAVVATGGGTFVDPFNRAAILADGCSFWLDVTFNEVVARLPQDGRRPLAANRAQMETLFHTRRAAYQHAHVRIDASVTAIDAIVEQILDRLGW